MQITRRDALATGAAAITTAAIATPLALKAGNVQAALGGDPVLPAYEAFEAARREYLAMDARIDAVRKAVEAEMPPEPHIGRPFKELSVEEIAEQHTWRTPIYERMVAILGEGEDDLRDPYYNRMQLAYEVLHDMQATTVAGMLCQVRAWWNVTQTIRDAEVPKPDPEASYFDPEVIVQRLYHDVARLAGEARP